MSITEPTLLSLTRATVVSLATLVVLLWAGQGIRSFRTWPRVLFFWPAMAALLTPGFVTAFAHFDSLMTQNVHEREWSYCIFVCFRLVPIALVITCLTPVAISQEGMHCLRLGTSFPWWRRKIWDLRAWGRGLWLGVAVVFFLTFQEFEIAVTWNMRAWPVSLFDAQAGGLALGDSLRLAVPPFVIQSALSALLVLLIRNQVHGQTQSGFASSSFELLTVVTNVGCLMICMFPVLLVCIGTWFAIKMAPGTAMALAPWREIANALILSSAATLAAWLLAGWIEKRRGWRWLLALPGLLGPLLCGLLLLALLQVPPLHLLRDTVFPPVLGLALVLLPFALLLRFGIETTSDSAALHTARASGGRCAVWQLDGWPRLCAVLMLFCFGYGDFTINSLLAPPQFTSVSVRLLNLLHYGRSSALMTMFILAFAVPLAAALLTALIARLYPRRRAS